MQRFHIGTQSICSSSYPPCPGRSWRSCRSKSCRAASSTSSRPSPAQLSPLSLCSASMTSSPSARTTPATASPWRCRLPSTTCYSRFVPLFNQTCSHTLSETALKTLKQKARYTMSSTEWRPNRPAGCGQELSCCQLQRMWCWGEQAASLTNSKKLAPVPLRRGSHVFLFSSPMGTSSWPHTDVRLTQPDLSSR